MMLYAFTQKFFVRGLVLLMGLWATVGMAAEQYHVVIDASGSMQRFDPQKQRIKALQQLVDEFPDGSQAGIWTYAGQVNMLVAPSKVDAAWRAKAHEALKNLGGYGAYANLTLALSQASHAWRGTAAEPGRNIILITNNGVKTSDNADQNKTVQDQLVNELLPQLKKSGVKIYDIGLSQADAVLLKDLATNTNGAYQQVASAADLSKAFAAVESKLGLKANEQQLVAANDPPAGTDTPDSNAVTTSTNETINATASTDFNTATQVPSDQTATQTSGTEAQSTTAAPTATAEPVVPEPLGLGEAESDEIRDALAQAETELQELLDEFASSTKVEDSPVATLSGQQLAEPLVITLNDGSVLVTSNQAQAQSIAGDAAVPVNTQNAPGSIPAENNPNMVNTPNTVNTEELGMHGNIEAPGTALGTTEATAEWPSAQRNDVWPMILTILAVVNIAVIALLFIGRYFWLRHKRKTNTGTYSQSV